MSIIVSPSEFNYWWFRGLPKEHRGRGNPRTRDKSVYIRLISAFDIETTALENDNSIMYIWQWQFGDVFTVVGRTWDEFRDFVDKLKKNSRGRQLVVFVHNLSYEFQFLRAIFNFQPDDVFAVQPRKILKAKAEDFLEFRCSYLHSNMNLKTYTEKFGAEHAKLSGEEFDYSKKRYPWTELSAKELEYCINDVLGLTEALTIEMKADGDNLYTFPLTSTGYVRRDAKKAMKGNTDHSEVPFISPDYFLYLMLRHAFRGGNTHANRFYTGKILENVSSADRSSSYPEVLCNCKYPIRKFFHEGPIEFEDLIRLIKVRHKAVIMRVTFRNIRLTNQWWGCPYISRHRVDIVDGVYDNGRVLSAERLTTCITDIDLKIILGEYTFDDCIVEDCYTSSYGYLPKAFTDVIRDYYVKKTTLKNVEGQELLYMKSKNKLNSLYGMTAQDPVKQNIKFVNGEFIEENSDPAAILEKHNKNAFLAYQWGVWTTAWARWMLEEGIKLAGPNFVYCDTDSVKYLGDINWDKFNKGRIKASKATGSFATDPKGITHYMGVYEFEGIYDKFSTLGAKKYATVTNGKLEVTIAGVNKKKGGKELGTIENFKESFIFKDAGGSELVYNDDVHIPYTVDGHQIEITSNVCIKDSTYTLGLTDEYERLIHYVQLFS